MSIAIREFDHVQIGRKTFQFTTSKEISQAYRATIMASGATGGGETGPIAPECKIFNASGKQTGRISYNGRVWRIGDGLDWKTDEIVYCPSEEQE